MWTWVLVLSCCCLSITPASAWAADPNFTYGSVAVASDEAGTRIISDYRSKAYIVLDPAATAKVWVLVVERPSDGSDPCPTAMTEKAGIPLSADVAEKPDLGREFDYDSFGARGTICAILDAAGDPQTVHYSTE